MFTACIRRYGSGGVFAITADYRDGAEAAGLQWNRTGTSISCRCSSARVVTGRSSALVRQSRIKDDPPCERIQAGRDPPFAAAGFLENRDRRAVGLKMLSDHP